MMRVRIELMRDLLQENGSIWISIDDRECHYLKIMCGEVFGMKNFVANIVWEKTPTIKGNAKNISHAHDYILVYAKNKPILNLNKIERTEEELTHYKHIDSNGKKYSLISLLKNSQNSRREDRPNLFYPIEAPDGTTIIPKLSNGQDGRWTWSKDKVTKEGYKLEWKKTASGWKVYRKIYKENNLSQVTRTLWLSAQVGSNLESKKESKALNPLDPFPTPKPERLLQRIIHLATNPGDLVLDAFAGSGTTGAVAHKMGRQWIMIEMGDHCHTHIVPRMNKVIAGEDQGGITKDVNWKGGGSFELSEQGR